MHKSLIKFSKEDREAFVNAISLDAFKKEVDAIKKADESDTGTFRVIISTEDRDRQGEVVTLDGWDLTFYKINPVVLWAHNYWDAPIAACTSVGIETIGNKRCLIATGKWAPTDEGQMYRKLYEGKFLNTTSVGFIPKEFDQETGTITKQELLEFSFVPVPANPYAISLDSAKSLGLDFRMMARKGIMFTMVADTHDARIKGVVPKNPSPDTEPEDKEWSKPTLSDFTDKTWDELGDKEKSDIAEHFAWAKEMPPASFEDLKLPHHDPKSHKAVWAGVKAAMESISGARGGVDLGDDKDAVHAHLAAHYKQFDKEVPTKSMNHKKDADGDDDADQIGDTCELDDGTPGVLAEDPNNPKGSLVCVPTEAKSAADENEGNTDEDEDPKLPGGDDPYDLVGGHKALVKKLTKDLTTEHDRHQKAVGGHIDKMEEAMAEDDGGEDNKKSIKGIDITDALQEFRTKMAGEHEKHKGEMKKCVKSYHDDMMKLLTTSQEAIDNGGANDDADSKKGMKAGATLSKATKEKITQIHKSITEAVATCEEMLKGGEGEESANGADDGKDPEEGDKPEDESKGSPNTRSNRAGESDINDFIMARTILREMQRATEDALQKFNKRGQKRARSK